MIKVVSASVFVGPSLFVPVPAVRLVLDQKALSGHTPTSLGPVFIEGILEFLTDTGEAVLDMARPGDLLVALDTNHDRTWPMVTGYKPS